MQRKDETRIHVLQLSGTPRQIGRTHGAAARAAGALGCVRFFGTFLDSLLRFDARPGLDRAFREAARLVSRRTIERRFIEGIPARYRETLEGFSEGSGLPADLLLRAVVMPDVYAYLMGRRFLRRRPVPLGCTSAVAFEVPGTREGILHARNLDYPGGRLWSSFPAIAEVTPEGGPRYVSVTTLGVETAGVTSMNEAGLTLALHMNYSRRVSTSGVPVVVLGNEVIRRASTLEEAVRILRSFPRGGGWTFVLASHREKSAVAVEFDADRIAVRPLERDTLVCANHFLDGELSRGEFWVPPGRFEDSRGRYDRARAIASASDPTDAGARMRALLADRGILRVHTVSSALLDPGRQKIWLARGALTGPESTYVAYRCFSGPVESETVSAAVESGPSSEARRSYAEAFERYFPSHDLEGVRERLERSARLDPDESLYPFLLGLVLLRTGDFPRAVASFETTANLPGPASRLSLARLYRARALDCSGRREEARSAYETVAGDPACRRQALRALRKPWPAARAARLRIDFTVGEPLESD